MVVCSVGSWGGLRPGFSPTAQRDRAGGALARLIVLLGVEGFRVFRVLLWLTGDDLAPRRLGLSSPSPEGNSMRLGVLDGDLKDLSETGTACWGQCDGAPRGCAFDPAQIDESFG